MASFMTFLHSFLHFIHEAPHRFLASVRAPKSSHEPGKYEEQGDEGNREPQDKPQEHENQANRQTQDKQLGGSQSITVLNNSQKDPLPTITPAKQLCFSRDIPPSQSSRHKSSSARGTRSSPSPQKIPAFWDARPDVLDHYTKTGQPYFRCIFLNSRGDRCQKQSIKLNRGPAINVRHALMDSIHAGKPVNELMIEYVRLCSCISHCNVKEKVLELSQTYQEQLICLYRSYARSVNASPAPPVPSGRSFPFRAPSRPGDSGCTTPSATELIDKHRSVGYGSSLIPGSHKLTDHQWESFQAEHKQVIQRRAREPVEAEASVVQAYKAEASVTEVCETDKSHHFSECPKLPLSALRDYLMQVLSGSEHKIGYIYAYTKKSAPNYIKVGYTTNDPSERFRQWDTDCDEEVKALFVSSKPIPFVFHIEKLIHIELQIQGLRLYERNCKCGCYHREWFKTTPGKVEQLVNYWTSLIEDTGLYHAEGYLVPAVTIDIVYGKFQADLVARIHDNNNYYYDGCSDTDNSGNAADAADAADADDVGDTTNTHADDDYNDNNNNNNDNSDNDTNNDYDIECSDDDNNTDTKSNDNRPVGYETPPPLSRPATPPSESLNTTINPQISPEPPSSSSNDGVSDSRKPTKVTHIILALRTPSTAPSFRNQDLLPKKTRSVGRRIQSDNYTRNVDQPGDDASSLLSRSVTVDSSRERPRLIPFHLLSHSDSRPKKQSCIHFDGIIEISDDDAQPSPSPQPPRHVISRPGRERPNGKRVASA